MVLLCVYVCKQCVSVPLWVSLFVFIWVCVPVCGRLVFPEACTLYCLLYLGGYTTYKAFAGHSTKPKETRWRDKAMYSLFSLSGMFPLVEALQAAAFQ